MQKKPFFTIVTVFLNDSNKIKATLDSLYSQTCEDYEHIIKDACSSEDEIERLKESVIENKSSIISHCDAGIYAGMNQALEISQGSFVYFLNAGDVLYDQNVLENVKKFIENRHDYSIFFGDVIFHPTMESTNYPATITKKFIFRKNICHQGIFISRQALQEVNGFREKTLLDRNFQAILSDQESTWSLVLNLGHKSIKVPFRIAIHENGGFSTNSNIFVRSWLERVALLINMFGILEFMAYGFLPAILSFSKKVILIMIGKPYSRTWKGLVMSFSPFLKQGVNKM